MEKYNTQICHNISNQLKTSCQNFMPNGHIGICCLSKDREYAQSVTSQLEFDFKLTFIEYPDDIFADEESARDIVDSPEDIRLFVGIGDRVISTLVAIASSKRDFEYILLANTPNLYGVGYALGRTETFENYLPKMPREVLVDSRCTMSKNAYAQCIGILIGHAVELIEKQYINYMCDKFDENLIAKEKEIIDRMLDDDLGNRQNLLKYELEYCQLNRQEFVSSQKLLARLIEEISLCDDRGDSSLLAAITLTKYFKSILKVENGYLTVPVDLTSKCRNISKLTGEDMSRIISHIEHRKFCPQWLYIHKEFREDFLNMVYHLESRLENLIKCAKRYMQDVGFHLGEEYDSNMLIQAVYNLSPLVEDASIVSMADFLGIG